jgi:phosphomannomutase
MGSGLERIKELVAAAGDTALQPIGPLRQEDVSSGYLDHLRKFAGDIRPMKVVLDCANGMASKWLPSLLRGFQADLESIHIERAGRFNRDPDLSKHEALAELKQRVRASGAALGAAFDADASRARFVDETGDTVPDDCVTALLAGPLLAREPGAAIVYDLRSTWALRELILARGGAPRRERAAPAVLKAAMREARAPLAAGLAGDWYYRDNYYCESPAAALLGLMTALSAEPGVPLSELARPLRRYFGTGRVAFEAPDPKAALKRLAQAFSDAAVDFLDGLTVEYPAWWFNARPAGGARALEVVLEAGTAELKDEMFEKLVAVLGEPSER